MDENWKSVHTSQDLMVRNTILKGSSLWIYLRDHLVWSNGLIDYGIDRNSIWWYIDGLRMVR